MKELEFYILAIDRYRNISVYGETGNTKLVINGHPIKESHLNANLEAAVKELCPDHAIVPVTVIDVKPYLGVSASRSSTVELIEKIKDGTMWINEVS